VEGIADRTGHAAANLARYGTDPVGDLARHLPDTGPHGRPAIYGS